MNKIYSIIVTYNGATWIEKCLESLINNSIQTEIIVIDNNSTDNTVKLIETKFECVHVIKSVKNLGFGKANNIGLRKAYTDKADFVFLLNQDAWIEPNAIEELIKVSQSNPTFHLFSPIQLNKTGTNFESGFMQYISPPFCDNLYYDSFALQKKDIYATSFVNAAAWLIPYNTIEEIGLFDPIFYHYGEDKDFCNRLMFHKKQIGVVPKSIVYHAREVSNLNNKDNFIEKFKSSIYKNYFLILIDLKNLNSRLGLQTFKVITALVKAALKNIFFLNINKAVLTIFVVIKIIIEYPIIKRHRKISFSKKAFI